MSESHPEESPQNEQGDAQAPNNVSTAQTENNEATLDTSDVGNTIVAEETSNVDQSTMETSAAKVDMAEEGQGTTEESVVKEESSSNTEEKTAPTQEEEFVVVQLTDGQQGEQQGTHQRRDSLHCYGMC